MFLLPDCFPRDIVEVVGLFEPVKNLPKFDFSAFCLSTGGLIKEEGYGIASRPFKLFSLSMKSIEALDISTSVKGQVMKYVYQKIHSW